MTMRIFELPAGPGREKGRAHGEAFRGEIGSLAAIRLHLCARMSGGSPAEVLQMARRHLPVLEAFDRELHQELEGIAEGAGLDPAQVVVLNHYTDLRDMDIGAGPGDAATDGCSAVFARTAGGPVAAQTWDMHATAIPYVMMLRVPEEGGQPGAWLLSLVGCLGMAGMNARGVALCINNLAATDAVIGPVWSAVVRRALRESTAAGARHFIMEARHGSGRHFLVADGEHAFGVEATGTRRRQIYGGEEASYAHTNHCLDPELGACTRIAPGATTFDRYQFIRSRLEHRPPAGPDEVWEILGSVEGYPRSVCSNLSTPEDPHGPATCAGLVALPAERVLHACAGLTHRARPERFSFDGAP
jgi:isopenicillin-N N-acyltransferase like protein